HAEALPQQLGDAIIRAVGPRSVTPLDAHRQRGILALRPDHHVLQRGGADLRQVAKHIFEIEELQPLALCPDEVLVAPTPPAACRRLAALAGGTLDPAGLLE